MSLVIGYTDEEHGFLMADTLLTAPTHIQPTRGATIEDLHCLKIHALSSYSAVAFVGNVQRAFRCICSLFQQQPPREEVSATLLRLSDEFDSEHECAFLVLSLADDGTTKLEKIENGEIRPCRRCYIGDFAEYRRYTQLYEAYNEAPPRFQTTVDKQGNAITQPYVLNPGREESVRIDAALRGLTEQRRDTTVGAVAGCITRLVKAWPSNLLEYLQSGEAFVREEEGVGGHSYLASNDGAVRGVALYFLGLKCGFLFIAGQNQFCHRIPANSIVEFIEISHEMHGVNLVGPMPHA